MTDKQLDLGDPKPHWELAGTVFPEDFKDFPKVLEVKKVKLFYTTPDSRKQKQISKHVLINGLEEELGIVGPSYQPVEARDIITPFLVARLPIMYYGVMGSPSQPRAWIMFAARNRVSETVAEHGVKPVIFVMNSFNKSRAIDFRPGVIRGRVFVPVHCPSFAIRHTTSAMGRLRALPGHIDVAEKCINDGLEKLRPVDESSYIEWMFEQARDIDDRYRVSKGNATRKVKAELQSQIDGKAMRDKLQLWKEI
jgi:hypothetical protein